MSTIMPAFDSFSCEGSLVGRLLAGYGDLEFDLCLCVASACDDFDRTLKTMFGERGERQRIIKARNIGEPHFKAHRLSSAFNSAVSGMHHCRQIRNQYAHCHWHDDYTGKLGFVVLEEIAKTDGPADLTNLTVQYVDVTLLRGQEAYFRHISQYWAYLNGECLVRAGKRRVHPWSKPEKMPKPLLHL